MAETVHTRRLTGIRLREILPGQIRHSCQGYTLIELALVLVIIGVLASVGLKSLGAISQTTRIEETRQEMERLACAIAGNTSLVSGGSRTDFGYVGDVGSLPPNLDALVTNPGGYATWDGPYLVDAFTSGGANTEFKYNAWGIAYTYSGGNSITSSGGGLTLTKQLANSTSDLLRNQVRVVVTDLDHTPPGTTYSDSVRFVLSVPNGTGSYVNRSQTPRDDGLVSFDSVPIGIHELRLIYLPTADTLLRKVAVYPGENSYLEISLAENIWSGS
ncbi:MAG: prepilin-type N-terminal cleavage/methylation domain-containing protein [candidate division Zixibacteria bacterium]|nr:prepilin-type N-terminal cleavage/methylation domain-containing protein [candidate division Zixibacteria bacterium]